jgi:predicted peroxiredoxin
MMEERNRRPLMYVATHGTDDPTLATLPFLTATGAGSAEIDCCIALVGEAASLAKPGMIDAVHGVGFPPLKELVEKVRDFNIPVYV